MGDNCANVENLDETVIWPVGSPPLLPLSLPPESPPPPQAVATIVMATAAATPKTRLLILRVPPGAVVAALLPGRLRAPGGKIGNPFPL